MPAFVLVNARDRTIELQTFNELTLAQVYLGLSGVDHGSFGRGYGYVVDEYGLFVPWQQQNYFGVGTTLIAGNMVVYAYNQLGETIDMSTDELKSIRAATRFFSGRDEIEQAIATGSIERPRTTVGDRLIWQWPDPDAQGRGDRS